MNQIFQHPLPLGQRVLATKPRCNCKGGGTEQVTGTILKVINNQSGFWYYLDSGSSVQDQWVINLL